MCSICGFLSDHERPTSIAIDMLQKTEHRGPDAHGLYVDGEIWRSRELSDLEGLEPARVCLGHSELSLTEGVINLVQPVGSPDGSPSLVLNGEIYNCQELRALLRDNCEIETEADDCEILMHLFDEVYDGNLLRTIQSVVKLLNGMYTLAVTDGEELVIARDPIGIKPLYYVEKEGAIFFCSEKKGLYTIDDTIKRIAPGTIFRATK
jgi:asparagine synthase (glutamine-hydrolysing)